MALARCERIDTGSGCFHSAECNTIEGWNYFDSITGHTGHYIWSLEAAKKEKRKKDKKKRVIRRAQTFLWDNIKTDLHANLSLRRSYTRNSRRCFLQKVINRCFRVAPTVCVTGFCRTSCSAGDLIIEEDDVTSAMISALCSLLSALCSAWSTRSWKINLRWMVVACRFSSSSRRFISHERSHWLTRLGCWLRRTSECRRWLIDAVVRLFAR